MPYFYIFSPYDFSAYEEFGQQEVEHDVFFIGEEKGDRKQKIY